MCLVVGTGTQTANIIQTSLQRNTLEAAGHWHPVFPDTDTHLSVHVLQEKQVHTVKYSRKKFIQ